MDEARQPAETSQIVKTFSVNDLSAEFHVTRHTIYNVVRKYAIQPACFGPLGQQLFNDAARSVLRRYFINQRSANANSRRHGVGSRGRRVSA